MILESHPCGDEELALEDLDAREPVLSFRLPWERPRISIRPRGEAGTEAPPDLATVLVEAEKRPASLHRRTG